VVARDGRERETDRTGRVTAYRAPGMEAHFGRNGRPDMVRVQHGDELRTIHRGPGGLRVVDHVRPRVGGGYARTYAFGPHHGFTEHPMGNRPGYMQRTYMVHGHSYAVVYRGYHYHGYGFYRPVPAAIYSHAYYGWAVHPWAAPVRIQVGFEKQPWYPAYGATFVPYPVYASPDQWMTDQILAENMQQAYEDGQDARSQPDVAPADAAGYASVTPPPVDATLKAQIDTQVKTIVQEQDAAAQSGPAAMAPQLDATTAAVEETPDALKPGHTVFRVGTPLTVEANGETCTLNTNDWVQRTGDLDAQTGEVPVTVVTSRPTDCANGAATMVALSDLTSMDNDLNQQVMAQLDKAAGLSGKNALPGMPPAGAQKVPGGQAAPDLDVTVQAAIQEQQSSAAADEQQAITASAAPIGG